MAKFTSPFGLVFTAQTIDATGKAVDRDWCHFELVRDPNGTPVEGGRLNGNAAKVFTFETDDVDVAERLRNVPRGYRVVEV